MKKLLFFTIGISILVPAVPALAGEYTQADTARRLTSLAPNGVNRMAVNAAQDIEDVVERIPVLTAIAEMQGKKIGNAATAGHSTVEALAAVLATAQSIEDPAGRAETLTAIVPVLARNE